MVSGSYRTLAAESRHEGDKIKGSRFIATAAPLASADQVAAFVERLRGEFPVANHHCWAYRIGPGIDTFRYSDDGEPSGTGGRPILQQIDGRDLTDTVVAVSRIFGGTKLGAGGLVRAYGGAAAQALDRAEIRVVVPVRRVVLTFGYELSGPVRGLLAEAGLTPVESSYGESVEMHVDIPEAEADAFLERLAEGTAGRVAVRGP